MPIRIANRTITEDDMDQIPEKKTCLCGSGEEMFLPEADFEHVAS